MRILLTNNEISGRTGTELYLCEVAEELKAKGHDPICFSLTVGPLAQRLIVKGIPVSDDLRALPDAPDVIHGHHFIETTLAALTYRKVPVISFCHGPEAWQESACRLPNVVHWVAIDQACRRRLIEDEGVDPARLTVMLNHYDQRKFSARGPLPPHASKALVISNYLHHEHPATAAISAACAARGIELTMRGAQLGGTVDNMETFLPQFDLVFAKARTAIEALAVGCAVVQVDYFGAGRMVRSEIYDELRPWNFGYRSMTFPLTAEHLGSEIDRYDAVDAALVSQRIRKEATLEKTMQNLVSLYEQALSHKEFLEDYDPVIFSADFLRFQLLLSKKPMESISKAITLPLRLPSYPIPPGDLAKSWKQLVAPHIAAAELEVEIRRTHAESEAALNLRNYHAEIARLDAKNTQLRTKLSTLADKNAQLKIRVEAFKKARPKRSIASRLRHLFR